MLLTPAELRQLTHRSRCDAQSRVLRFMGIEHRRRPDGSIAVLRAHVDRVLDGADINFAKQVHCEPDWSQL